MDCPVNTVILTLEDYERLKKFETKNKELEAHTDTVRIISSPDVPSGYSAIYTPTVQYEIKDEFVRKQVARAEGAERKLEQLKSYLRKMNRRERKEFIKHGRWEYL